MKVTIKAKVTKAYDRIEGEYLGTPFYYQDFIAMEAETPGESSVHPGVMAFRVKGANLDRFLREGIVGDHIVHDLTLLIDCKETTFRDGSVHPNNKMPVLIEW